MKFTAPEVDKTYIARDKLTRIECGIFPGTFRKNTLFK